MEQTTVASGGGNPEKLTANGKERAVITNVGKRSDLGWESRGWKFTQEELANPPSLRDNMNDSEEKEYRRKAHTFIYDCCQVLRAKALVIAAAMTISQRYFSQVSFRKIDRSDTAAAAIFLASKVEEFRVHIKDVMMVTHRVRHKNERRLVENSDEYNRYKDRLLKAENQLVNALGFDFMIEHPFGHSNDLVAYLCEEGWVPADKSALISKGSHHLLIKSLRGTLCLEYPPTFRARLVTYLSLLVNNISPPPGGWAEMIEFEDHRRLNRAACQLLETLDDDSGKTGKKITKKRVAAALVEAGHIKNKNAPNRVPRQPPGLTYADRDRMAARSSYIQSPHGLKRGMGGGNLNGSAVASRSGSSSHDKSSWIGQPRPRPPSSQSPASVHTESGKRRRTEDATSNGNASRPRPPPPPPRTPRPPITPKPPSTPKPRPPSTSKPRPPSTHGQLPSSNSKPRPPSTPKPRPPSTPKPLSTNGQQHSSSSSSSSKPRPRPPPPRLPTTPSAANAYSDSGSRHSATPLSSSVPPHPPEPHSNTPNGSISRAALPLQKGTETRPPRFSDGRVGNTGDSPPKGKAGASSAQGVPTGGGEEGKGKRSRDAGMGDESSADPGSGGKRSRLGGSGRGAESGSASTVASSDAVNAIESGEVEDGEISINAVPVLRA